LLEDGYSYEQPAKKYWLSTTLLKGKKMATILERAKVAIALDHPFFASILMRRELIVRRDIQTLAVDMQGQIFYNPEFVESLTVQQAVWGLCHEVFHVIGLHSVRCRGREHQKWNLAGDAYINDTLDDCKIGQRIPNCVDMPGSKDKTVEKIYDELPDPPPQGGGGGGGGGDSPGGDGLGGDILYEGAPQSEGERAAREAEMRVEVAQAAMAAKMRGKMPSNLQRFVDEIIAVKTPWYDILERWATERVKNDYTWRKPNRRFVGDNIYLPSMDDENRFGELVIVVDVSGSIGQRELNYFAGHVNRIIDQVCPTKVHVLYVDAAVNHADTYSPEDYPIVLTPHGGGGTDMRVAFDWCKRNAVEPKAVVVLTDGYTPFPESQMFPTIWAVVDSGVTAPACAGETVHFNMDD
jgi:predicted metal-dependent peptidase